MNEVWIVDDDRSIRWVLEKVLTKAGFTCRSFSDGNAAWTALQNDCPGVLISDIRMPGPNGIDLLTRIKEKYPKLPVIITTAFSDLESAVSAFQKGAFEYLPKPFDINKAVQLVQRAMADQEPSAAADEAEENEEEGHGTLELIGKAPVMQDVFRAIGRLSHSSMTVLITGESGAGKEVVARALHRSSPRSKAPFIALNMAAIPRELMESELFGHERGAFTGALNTGKPGLIEAAHGGTLFLDEINSLPLALQGKFLRVLESHKSKRLGAVEEQEIDFRLLAATNQNLKEGVLAGTFRADLYYRLNVIPLELPPLRERREDIAPLATFFLDYYCKRYSRTKVLSRRVIEQLKAYDWPGNIRELKNVVERLLVTSAAGTLEIYQDLAPLLGEDAVRSTSPEIYPADWEAFYQFDPEHFSLKAYMEFCEKHVLADALKRCPSSYKAAALLKTDQSTIVRKRKKYGL